MRTLRPAYCNYHVPKMSPTPACSYTSLPTDTSTGRHEVRDQLCLCGLSRRRVMRHLHPDSVYTSLPSPDLHTSCLRAVRTFCYSAGNLGVYVLIFKFVYTTILHKKKFKKIFVRADLLIVLDKRNQGESVISDDELSGRVEQFRDWNKKVDRRGIVY